MTLVTQFYLKLCHRQFCTTYIFYQTIVALMRLNDEILQAGHLSIRLRRLASAPMCVFLIQSQNIRQPLQNLSRTSLEHLR